MDAGFLTRENPRNPRSIQYPLYGSTRFFDPRKPAPSAKSAFHSISVMKIGLDARLVHWPGIGRYIQTLVKQLPTTGEQHRFVFYFATPQDCQNYGVQRPNVENRVFHSAVFSLQEQLHWPARLKQDNLDLFHAPHYTVPLLAACPLVMTLHDLVGFRYPHYLYSAAARLYYQWMTRLAVRKSARILLDSRFTQTELLSLFSVPPGKTEVVYLGIEEECFTRPPAAFPTIQEKYRLPEPYMLYVGTYKPWKNLPVLLEAVRLLRQQGEKTVLVLAGKPARHQQDVSALIQTLGLSDQVVEVGYIEEADLTAVYAHAQLFVFPSRYEGFGLPVLEAMAAGTAVVAGRAAALPEVVGQAGWLVNPDDPGELAHALHTLLNHPEQRNEFGWRGQQRATQFPWQTCVQQTLNFYAL